MDPDWRCLTKRTSLRLGWVGHALFAGRSSRGRELRLGSRLVCASWRTLDRLDATFETWNSTVALLLLATQNDKETRHGVLTFPGHLLSACPHRYVRVRQRK